MLRQNICSKIAMETALVAAALLCLLAFCAGNAEEAFADTIFVGDSRTCGMYDAIYGRGTDEISEVVSSKAEKWRAKVGSEIDWFANAGVSYVDAKGQPGDAIVILMGVNDLAAVHDYAKLINDKSAEWAARGEKTYFVSVNPVNDQQNARSGYTQTNAQIEMFNATIRPELQKDVVYIDTYSVLVDDLRTYDGLHYEASTYLKIYNMINSAVLEPDKFEVTDRPIADGRNAPAENAGAEEQPDDPGHIAEQGSPLTALPFFPYSAFAAAFVIGALVAALCARLANARSNKKGADALDALEAKVDSQGQETARRLDRFTFVLDGVLTELENLQGEYRPSYADDYDVFDDYSPEQDRIGIDELAGTASPVPSQPDAGDGVSGELEVDLDSIEPMEEDDHPPRREQGVNSGEPLPANGSTWTQEPETAAPANQEETQDDELASTQTAHASNADRQSDDEAIKPAGKGLVPDATTGHDGIDAEVGMAVEEQRRKEAMKEAFDKIHADAAAYDDVHYGKNGKRNLTIKVPKNPRSQR